MTTIAWPLYSCDDHLDLPALPPDLWQERLPAKWRERGPHVEARDGRRLWIADDVVIGASGRSPYSVYERAGVDDDGFRASRVPARLADMERDGITVSVIYGPSVMGLPIPDDDLQAACLVAWNDWAAEFNAQAPDRLCILARLPSRQPDVATAELERVAGRGHRGAVLDPFEAEPGTPEWEPFWAAADACGLPISFHLSGGTRRLRFEIGSWRAPAFASIAPMQLDEPLVEVMFSGVLERHPGVRLVLAEAGIGWVPYVVGRMDLEWEHYRGMRLDRTLSQPPSELFHRQVYATFEEEPMAADIVPLLGAERVMWASDYPHPDSTFPESRDAIARDLGALSAGDLRRITADNCRELYGFPRFA